MSKVYDENGDPVTPEDVLDPQELAAYYETQRKWGQRW